MAIYFVARPLSPVTSTLALIRSGSQVPTRIFNERSDSFYPKREGRGGGGGAALVVSLAFEVAGIIARPVLVRLRICCMNLCMAHR